MATKTYHSPDLYKGADRGRIYRITPSLAAALARQPSGWARRRIKNSSSNWRIPISGGAARRSVCWSTAKARARPVRWRKLSRPALLPRDGCTRSGPSTACTSSTRRWSRRPSAMPNQAFGKTRLSWPRAACRRPRARKPAAADGGRCESAGAISASVHLGRHRHASVARGPGAPAGEEYRESLDADRGLDRLIGPRAGSGSKPPRQFTDRNTPGRTSFFRQVASVIGSAPQTRGDSRRSGSGRTRLRTGRVVVARRKPGRTEPRLGRRRRASRARRTEHDSGKRWPGPHAATVRQFG